MLRHRASHSNADGNDRTYQTRCYRTGTICERVTEGRRKDADCRSSKLFNSRGCTGFHDFFGCCAPAESDTYAYQSPEKLIRFFAL